MRTGTPVLVIQWTQSEATARLGAVITRLARPAEVAWQSISRPGEARQAIADWLTGNANARFLVIAGLGDPRSATDPVTLDALRDWLSVRQSVVWWLGGYAARGVDARLGAMPMGALRIEAMLGSELDDPIQAFESLLGHLLERIRGAGRMRSPDAAPAAAPSPLEVFAFRRFV